MSKIQTYCGQHLVTEPIVTPIQTVTVSHQEYAIATIVLAFSADPVVRWMYPEPQQYLTYFPNFVRAFAGKAFEHGTAYCVEDYSATALWLPPGVEPDEESLIVLLEQSTFDSEQADIFAILEQMGYYHPHEPHWYLPLIGVEPTQQSKGYGSALMQHTLLQCDHSQILAYLESSNPANIPFYERHGFERVGIIQVGTSPPIFPMVRHPQ